MSAELTKRAAALFREALLRTGPARDDFLADACAGDATLLQEVLGLLQAHELSAGFMESSGPHFEAPVTGPPLPTEQPGDRIGNYKLIETVGEGGFGIVWIADQERPVRRRVALKIIKPGMDTRQVIARFEQERQALALMDHPNIARVLDAGATPLGRPFFVMDLVLGSRITEYCDEAKLPTPRRLELFILVCRAVQHAHQKGIIHRDLKPSNILVVSQDGPAAAGVPKVIDFGVAKAAEAQRLTDVTIHTQAEQMIGTPLYMSPEQSMGRGIDVDTRSDIYSLGVVLYELLTGRTPHDSDTLLRHGHEQMRRVIQEHEAAKPSTLISTLSGEAKTAIAQRRQMEGGQLAGVLRGDLDWIVMKAIEKDRSRRYQTADAFANDIMRHLKNEPVAARPPSRLYRFRRMVRRNKVVVGAGAGIAAALLAGITVSIWQAVRAQRGEARAEAALDDLRASAPAFAAEARALVRDERFVEAIQKFDYAIKLRPDVPEYWLAKADLLESQLRFAEASASYRRALRLRPGHQRALSNSALCDRLAGESARHAKISRESLGELLTTMIDERRTAAEMMLVARLVGEESKIALEYWTERLKELPLPAKPVLEERLTFTGEGLFLLDLSKTPITDLAVLKGMPIASLNLGGCPEFRNLQPLEGMPLRALTLDGTQVTDLSPLAEIKTLRELSLRETGVADLSPLRTSALTMLDITATPVSDLAPLRDAPLQILRIGSTSIGDLSATDRMPLRELDCTGIPADDFSPLAQAPLQALILQGTRVSDLAFLRKMPLKALSLHLCREVRNLQVLNEIRTIQVLILPEEMMTLPPEEVAAIEAFREHPSLRQIESGVPMEGAGFSVTGSKELFWKQWDLQATYLGPLRAAGIRAAAKIQPDGTWAISLRQQRVHDLSSLRGAPVSRLDLNATAVTDLSPVNVLPLKWLSVQNTGVTNVSALAGLPLTELYMDGCGVAIDVAVLTALPTLEKVTLPVRAKNLDALRHLPNIRFISFAYDDKAARPVDTSQQFWSGTRTDSEEVLAWQHRFQELQTGLLASVTRPGEAYNSFRWLQFGAVALAAGDAAAYRSACSEMLMRSQNGATLEDAERTTKLCLLSDNPPANDDDLARLKGIVASKGDDFFRQWTLFGDGLGEFRRGEWKKAISFLERVHASPYVTAPAAAVMAMSFYRQHDLQSAHAALTRARELRDNGWLTTRPWPDYVVAHVLLSQAETMIGDKPAGSN